MRLLERIAGAFRPSSLRADPRSGPSRDGLDVPFGLVDWDPFAFAPHP
jgi:hypothetical protein